MNLKFKMNYGTLLYNCNFGRTWNRDAITAFKDKPYKEFLSMLTNVYYKEFCDVIEPKEFDKIETTETKLVIREMGEDDERSFYTIENENGFTTGSLLYALANVLPNENYFEENSYICYLYYDEFDNCYTIAFDY